MARSFLQNIKPSAQNMRLPKGNLFYFGTNNLGWEKIGEILCEGKFPDSVRGNFAFIWQGEHETIAAVDHVTTFPLFYSDQHISHIFHDLTLQQPNRAKNQRVQVEIELLGGQSFLNQKTTCVGVSRILPGHYLRGNKQIPYISFHHYMGDEAVDLEAFAALIEQQVLFLAKEKNLLLLSGGTDSTTLAAIIKKIGMENRFSFVHAYSNKQPLTEKHLVEKIAEEMQLKVNYSRVDFSGDVIPSQSGRQFAFWVENPFSAKRMAAEVAGHTKTRLFTGELGDQLFGGPKNSPLLNYALQSERISAEEIAVAWINLSTTYGRHSGVKAAPRVVDIIEKDDTSRAVYEELVHYIALHFSRMQSHDFLQRVMLLNYLIKGPYRTWAYSQDTLDWVHPFAAWEVFDFVFRLKSSEKIKQGGIQKYIFLDVWGPYLSKIPWDMPKHGFGIPAISKLRDKREISL